MVSVAISSLGCTHLFFIESQLTTVTACSVSIFFQPLDLNSVDYEVWGILQRRVYRSRIRDVDHLKQLLVEEWCQFDQNIIDRAV